MDRPYPPADQEGVLQMIVVLTRMPALASSDDREILRHPLP
jgi:hypothetical protein